MLSTDRYFDPDPNQKTLARELYAQVQNLPIISPHGHVDPALFAEPDRKFGNPCELLIQPDHYVLRMLYSQGISYEELLSKENPRRVWRLFAGNFHLYRGTPSGLWLAHELEAVFGVVEKLNATSADRIYDQVEAALASPDFSPRTLFERFNIEVLATTDSAQDRLEHHQAIRLSGWGGRASRQSPDTQAVRGRAPRQSPDPQAVLGRAPGQSPDTQAILGRAPRQSPDTQAVRGRIIPTFRPDSVTNLLAAGWRENIEQLSAASGIDIANFPSYIRALEQRRAFFQSLGATASDNGVASPVTEWLALSVVEKIFQRALKGRASPSDAQRFSAHMLMEMARMSTEDGLVMQIHAGVFRNHNPEVLSRFGPDKGFDIPIRCEFTHNLQSLLAQFGNHPNLHLILFTLDETAYARELAPLAGAYPSVKLGPPWWFHDSWNGMRRYFDQVMETAGVYNTAGFNDDTRAFLSIPARHDVWRRAGANWLAGLLVRGMIDRTDAESLLVELAYGLAKRAYRLE